MAGLREWWDPLGVGGVIIVGLALFFLPEPVTSVVGIVIILIAAVVWLAGWYAADDSDDDTGIERGAYGRIAPSIESAFAVTSAGENEDGTRVLRRRSRRVTGRRGPRRRGARADGF
jgi:hypothetical protein